MSAVDTLLDALRADGFTEDTAGLAAKEATVAAMSHNGPYVIHAVLARGTTRVTVEQNTSPDLGSDDPEVAALITHPAVAVVESPRGRAGAKASDLDAVRAVITDLS